MPLAPKPIFLIIVAVVITAITLVLSLVFDISKHPTLIKEGGLIETLSATGYFVCALLIIAVGKWAYIKQYNYFLILIVAFGMRELNFDKRFTTMGILKSRFYSSDGVPLIEKLIGLIVIAVLIYAVVSIVKNHYKGFVHGVMQWSEVHIGVLLTIALLMVTKTIDGIARKLADLGLSLAAENVTLFSLIEEVLELGIPLLLISVYVIYFSREKH